jgi:VanZ family protein
MILNTGKKKLILILLITIGWMIVIFLLSSQPAVTSNNLSKSVTRIVDSAVDHVKTAETGIAATKGRTDISNDAIRDYAHASVFLVLAFLVYLALTTATGLKGLKAAAVTFVLCALYAASDEIHQLFVLGRACELSDFARDCAGILSSLVIIAILHINREEDYP